MTDREQTKRLWQMCFDDSREFVDLYFGMRYGDDINRTIKTEAGEVAAALQVIPYPMTFCGSMVGAGYVSGACTHPSYRGRGLMRRLLDDSLRRMWRDGDTFAVVIPGQESLRRYYAESGFAEVFTRADATFTPKDAYAPPAGSDLGMEGGTGYREDEWMYLNKKLSERPACLMHTRADYRVILSALAIEGGRVYTLRRAGQAIAALAVVNADGRGGFRVEELVFDDRRYGAMLLQQVCRELGAGSLTFVSTSGGPPPRHTFGMARIVNAIRAFRLYAAANRSSSFCIDLADPLIPANNGSYWLRRGRCTKISSVPPTGSRPWTVEQAACMLFYPAAPRMSLMLDR